MSRFRVTKGTTIEVETRVVMPPQLGQIFIYDDQRFITTKVIPCKIADSLRPWKSYAGWKVTGTAL